MQLLKSWLLGLIGFILTSILINKLLVYFLMQRHMAPVLITVFILFVVFLIAIAIIDKDCEEPFKVAGGTLLIFLLVGWIITGLLDKNVKYVFIFGVPLFVIPIALTCFKKVTDTLSKKAEANRKIKAAQEKEARRLSAFNSISDSGYFEKQAAERLKAFNADPESLSKEFQPSDRTGRRLWMTLDEQLEYLEQNESRMDDLSLNYSDYNYLKIINKSLQDIKAVMYSNQMSAFIQPLKEIYSRYNFDFNESFKALNDAIYSYNGFYSEVSKDYYGQLKGKNKGVTGEETVSRILEAYKDIVWNLTNIRFEVEGESVESDSILISDYGLWSLEIKNYGKSGDTIYIAKDGRWTIEHADGDYEVKGNVAGQLGRHIGYKQRLINDELRKKLNDDTIPYISMEPLVVIANENVRIENESDIPVVRPSNVYFYIKNHRSERPLDRKYWTPIKEIILENNLPPKRFPLDDYFECLQQEYDQLWERIKAYYALSSIAKTYVRDLIDQGCDLTYINLRNELTLEYANEAQLKGAEQDYKTEQEGCSYSMV